MKKVFTILLIALLFLGLCTCSLRRIDTSSPGYYPTDVTARLTCTVAPSITGNYINNKIKMVNVWNRDTFSTDTDLMEKSYLQESLPFIEIIEVMTATGGNESLDLFKDPLNYDIVDDYDFTKLVTACKKIIDLGLRPSLKLGNVPLKLTGKPIEGAHFGVTVRPPYDYNLYYDYIYALTQALTNEFGKDNVAKWRFGVLTEYDNVAWYTSGTNDKEEMIANYCKLYDYTTAALQDVLGNDIYVGAHSEGAAFLPQAFIRHCAEGINYKTGEIGSPLRYIDVSFYSDFPSSEIPSLLNKIEPLRETAIQYGLTDLEFGTGEGRILFGRDGKPLFSRITSDNIQAVFDAVIYKESVDYDVDYISAWPSFTSNGLAEGFPLINMHMANLFYKMVGTYAVQSTVSGRPQGRCQLDSLCSYDKVNQKLYILTYDLFSALNGKNPKNDMSYQVKMPTESGSVKITKYVLDDNCNFYDDWLEDMDELGINSSDFSSGWSEESTPPSTAMSNQIAIDKFKSKSADYEKASTLIPTQDTIPFSNYSLQLYHDFDANTVVFYEIEIIK